MLFPLSRYMRLINIGNIKYLSPDIKIWIAEPRRVNPESDRFIHKVNVSLDRSL